MTHHIDLATITLDKGGHSDPDAGLCVMEAVAYFAGEPHSDHPPCVSPVIGAFLRRWNDDLGDEDRQKLTRLIPLAVGTNTSREDDNRRAWMVTDWMVRTYLPAWLTLGGMADQASAVAALPELTDGAGWKMAAPTVADARKSAAAAGAAAGAAAWAAAGDAASAAAGAAARAAARAAAGDAARAAASAAAWDAAWDAAGAAAGDAAWAAAWAAARDAAWDAASAAARDAAWAAAWDAARDAVRPTAEGLQASALDLVERLCAVGRAA